MNKTEIVTTTTSKSMHRFLVALGLPKPVPALVLYAQNVVTRIAGNPLFPNPVPQLAAVTAAIAALQAAEAAAISRIKGAATRVTKAGAANWSAPVSLTVQ